jgi:peroxiredoxin
LPIYVGVQTLPAGGDINAWNTFGDDSEDEMYEELELTEALISDAEHDTFEGFSIYDYANYVALTAPEPSTLVIAGAGLFAIAAIARKRLR